VREYHVEEGVYEECAAEDPGNKNISEKGKNVSVRGEWQEINERGGGGSERGKKRKGRDGT